jgi:hypothetical protein
VIAIWIRTCIGFVFPFLLLNVSCRIHLQEVARPKQEFDTQSFEDVAKGRQEQQLGDARKQQGMPNLVPYLIARGLVAQQSLFTGPCPCFCGFPYMSNQILR